MEFVVFTGVLLFIFLFMIVQELIQAKIRKKFSRSIFVKITEKEPPKEYSLERFARLGSYLERHKEEKQLDDITWNDLGMDEVFCRIDRTLFSGGRGIPVFYPPEYLLREEKLDHLEEVTGWFWSRMIWDPGTTVTENWGIWENILYDYLDNLDYLGERNNRKILLLNLLYLPFASLLFVQPAIGILGIVLCMGHILTYFREKK